MSCACDNNQNLAPSTPSTAHPLTRWQECAGLLLDLDGVITPTLDIHKRAWHNLFAPFLQQRATELGREIAPYTMADYHDYVDGRHRLDGVRSVLASRDLPDAADDALIEKLGLQKNDEFLRTLNEEGITAYPGTVALLEEADQLGIPYAVVSSSRNTRPVLQAAGLLERFEIIVDGNTAVERGLPGKPAPDTYLYAAELLGVPAAQAVVVEDALSGVAAGKAGHFGLVVGVDRGTGAEELRAAGADLVVSDLAEVL